MDVSNIFDNLNEAQRDAVASGPGTLLVLAGAGSGKTRVLTCRIAWLVQALDISPMSVMAVTFTNKASREMRQRIESILGYSVAGMWMGTFHGLSHRLLRTHHGEAGLDKNFQIIDADDQYRLLRRLLRDMGLDEAYWPPRQVQWFVNDNKERGQRARSLGQLTDPQVRQLAAIYERYEATCNQLSLVDFAELMLRSFELLRNNEPVREHYQRRFKHLLVDEFQDTNAIQYRWLKMFRGPDTSLMAVGDDDQSIYGWRGARVENMLQFESEFENARTVRLEQNYRSTSNILNAANAVINQNDGRLGKKLWTEGQDGEPLYLYSAFNDFDESRFVVDRISRWVEKGNKRSDVAILYRSNAQSRVFEEQLIQQAIPYRVYGGLRFFERAEIKDALAYLRLLSNRASDPAFERVINVPARGIGGRTVEKIRRTANEQHQSLWQATRHLVETRSLSSRAHSCISQFLELIDTLDTATSNLELGEMTQHVLVHSGLLAHFRKEKGEKAEARIENLEELVTATQHFQVDRDDEGDALSQFLSHAALEAGEGQAEEWEDCVQLMSLHSAKGLEFPLVFLAGLEEGLFPHSRSMEDPGQLEEERRLCYVGMTRAMQELVLSYAEIRRLHGQENYTRPSRFISEIPQEFVQEIRRKKPVTGGTRERLIARSGEFSLTAAGMAYGLGDRVSHQKFGDGIVTNVEGQGEYARVQINFEQIGSKWLVLSYANLQRI